MRNPVKEGWATAILAFAVLASAAGPAQAAVIDFGDGSWTGADQAERFTASGLNIDGKRIDVILDARSEEPTTTPALYCQDANGLGIDNGAKDYRIQQVNDVEALSISFADGTEARALFINAITLSQFMDDDGGTDIETGSYSLDGGISWIPVAALDGDLVGVRTFRVGARATNLLFRAPGVIAGPQDHEYSVRKINVSPPETNLLDNVSFEIGTGVPLPWQGLGLGGKDKRSSLKALTGAASFQIVGGAAQKSIRQKVALAGKAGDAFYLKGSSAASGPNATGRYELAVKIAYADGTAATVRLGFPRNSHAWKKVSGTLIAAKDYTSLTLYCRYWNQSGRAWFDDLVLRRK
jgi:hypothetical protein